MNKRLKTIIFVVFGSIALSNCTPTQAGWQDWNLLTKIGVMIVTLGIPACMYLYFKKNSETNIDLKNPEKRHPKKLTTQIKKTEEEQTESQDNDADVLIEETMNQVKFGEQLPEFIKTTCTIISNQETGYNNKALLSIAEFEQNMQKQKNKTDAQNLITFINALDNKEQLTKLIN